MGHRFYVMKHHGAWRIRHNDRYSAPFDDPDAAIRKVMVFARWCGQDLQVLVQVEGNAFSTEWISGQEARRS